MVDSVEGSMGPENGDKDASSTNKPSFIHRFITDSRTEWSLRYTVLHVIFYVLFFYPPSTTNVNIDWSLPVQLISGGNLAFYNAGWFAWFGLGCAFSMVMAGCILSIIFPLLQSNNLTGGYFILMLLFLVLSLPMIKYIGTLNNLRSIGFLLIIIFTEIFFGPLLNFRNDLPSAKYIFVEFVGPNAIPSLIFIGICWGVFIIPPWHSATYQMLSLSSEVMVGVSDCLRETANTLRSKCSNETNDDDETRSTTGQGDKLRETSQKDKLRSIANSLLKQTNYAGLYTPISLYGDMGTYETSILYPASSLPANSFHLLGKYIDQTIYHVALVIWALSEIIDEVDDDDLILATAKHLKAAADLAQASSVVLQCPRKNYRQQPATSVEIIDAGSINTKKKLFDVPRSVSQSNSEAKELAHDAQTNAKREAKSFQDAVSDSTNRFHALLLHNITSDLTAGHQHLVHFNHDHMMMKEEGSLGRLMHVAENLQESWSDSCAWPRMVSRLTYLEAISDLTLCWFQGVMNLLSCIRHGRSTTLDKRQLTRALQFAIGAGSLLAMTTWWEEFSTLLGSSSTGQWTLVSFFVCFRATADETIYNGLTRSLGHAIGGLSSWGINTAVVSAGGRIGCHSALTLVFTWLIPTPFCITPSTFRFPFDMLSLTLLEGAMTTYHLTSVLVLSTSVESATKARMASQCIGAAAAAVVSLVFPWFAKPEAERMVKSFNSDVHKSIQQLGNLSSSDKAVAKVEELLQARRDVSNAKEAKAWMGKTRQSDNLGEELTKATFGQVAVEAIIHRYEKNQDIIPNEVTVALKDDNLNGALTAIQNAICKNEIPQNELARLYVDILLLKESLD